MGEARELEDGEEKRRGEFMKWMECRKMREKRMVEEMGGVGRGGKRTAISREEI